MLQLAEEQQIIDSIILAAAKVGVGNLLASAFSSTLGSTVVSYEQYEHEKDKKDRYFTELTIGQLFKISNISGQFGDKPQPQPATETSMAIYVKTLTGKTLIVETANQETVESQTQDKAHRRRTSGPATSHFCWTTTGGQEDPL